jgi:hypothetical protein
MGRALRCASVDFPVRGPNLTSGQSRNWLLPDTLDPHQPVGGMRTKVPPLRELGRLHDVSLDALPFHLGLSAHARKRAGL